MVETKHEIDSNFTAPAGEPKANAAKTRSKRKALSQSEQFPDTHQRKLFTPSSEKQA